LRFLYETNLRKKLCKVLEKSGWQLARVRGSHYIYTKTNSPKIIVIPIHGNRDLPTGTLRGILKDAGLTENDL
jgi:predicted RNA binding protein YcfA (HicA-like mRNA interferase family)